MFMLGRKFWKKLFCIVSTKFYLFLGNILFISQWWSFLRQNCRIQMELLIFIVEK
jgi:hypothetical protein